VALGLLFLGALAGLLWWRQGSLASIGSAFSAVRWQWVVVAIALNLLSVIVRALAWTTVIHSAMEPPYPRAPLVFSAFSVGLFANAVLPGRIGELARVAVLTRKLPGRRGAWATLVGTVFAHRVFDIVPVLLLILYVVLAASIPTSARASLLAVIAIGVALFGFAFVTARRPTLISVEGLSPVRRLLAMGRAGLGVMRSPVGTAGAIFFQICGWTCQIFAVYTAMRAFDIHSPLAAAGVVLLLMNVVTIFPFWPGNVGLVQVAIASALVGYGVSYSVGVAYGFGLQAIEASVGIGVGLLFLAREGLSFAMLRVMPAANQAELPGEGMGDDERREESRAAVS
jgi:uncharacterized membrane protein YbhN (UPF0104 family)